jgi:hypothetical protein
MKLVAAKNRTIEITTKNIKLAGNRKEILV